MDGNEREEEVEWKMKKVISEERGGADKGGGACGRNRRGWRRGHNLREVCLPECICHIRPVVIHII